MRRFAIWLFCGAALAGALVIDWRAAGLMFLAAWADRLLERTRDRNSAESPSQ
jgi:hypothetical protein